MFVNVWKAPDSLRFQLSGYYDDYHWSRVCFESKHVCFGTITSEEDVTDSTEGDCACLHVLFNLDTMVKVIPNYGVIYEIKMYDTYDDFYIFTGFHEDVKFHFN